MSHGADAPPESVTTDGVVLAGADGTATPWLADVVSALGYEPAATVLTDRPEDGRYYLPPGAVERVEGAIERTGSSLVVVDGRLHVGQVVDLDERLPDVGIRDRPGVVRERLARSNPVASDRLPPPPPRPPPRPRAARLRRERLARSTPVASDRLALERARLERRRVERALRGQGGGSPDGIAGRVADLDRRCDRLRERLSERRRAVRARVETAHVDADAYAVTVSELGAESRVHPLEDGTAPPSPAAAETDVVTVGVHDVAVTDVPAIPWTGRVPEWFEAVVPGAIAAVERAEVVCSTDRQLAEHLASRFDAEPVALDLAGGDSLDAALAARLESRELEVSLPAVDEAHATVSWLYDRADVREVTYGEHVELSVTVPEGGVDAVGRRVRDAGGRVECAPTSREG